MPIKNRITSLLAGWVFTLASLSAEEKKAPPNILIILADDLGYSDLHCFGGPIETPNLDSLAENGLRLTQFYNTARCWPTRTALMTGYYYPQVRRKGSQRQMLPNYLAPLGYRNYHSGKWHVFETSPTRHGGFNRSFYTNNYDRFFTDEGHRLDGEQLPSKGRTEGYYVTKDIARRAIGFLGEHAEGNSDSPFLLYLAFTSPHFPLQALEEDIAKYEGKFAHGWDEERKRRQRRLKDIGLLDVDYAPRDERLTASWTMSQSDLKTEIHPGETRWAVAWDTLSDEEKAYQATKMAIHCAMVDRMDQEIGEVIAQLKKMGSFEDTLIVFFSDNGASSEQLNRGEKNTLGSKLGSADSYLCLGAGWSTAANTPFRLHKHWAYEGGISSPFIAHWPAGIAAKGQVNHTPAHVIDLLPTFVDLAGGRLESEVEQPELLGKSLVSLLKGEGVPEREVLYWNHEGNQALREGDWKLARSKRYLGDRWELYNLAEDRGERVDLASEHPERVERMEKRWQEMTVQFEEDHNFTNSVE